MTPTRYPLWCHAIAMYNGGLYYVHYRDINDVRSVPLRQGKI